MPLIAIVVGLAALIWWGLVLLSPLIGLFVIVVIGAQAFGTAFNGAVGMGLSVLILPALIYLPIVFFSYLLPALARLLAHFVLGVFTEDSFTPNDAIETVTHHKARMLSFFGLARRPKKLGE